ncbi:MAG: NTP transferase domain-containing protein [Chloroflexi bacterium]|nr:NTP transferase domain-containing protein [Chloroflexota bacterium]
MPERHPLTGAILVGGRSRRMGRDKALMVVDEDRPLIRQLVALLELCCDEVLLVGGDPARFAGLGLAARCVGDAVPGAGPLAGILGALEETRNDACLVTACDMPFVTAPVLGAMAAQPRGYAVLAYPAANGFEPLLAIYTRACVEPLRSALAARELHARRFLDRVETRVVPAEVLDRVDPDRLAGTNINTPEELAAARPKLVVVSASSTLPAGATVIRRRV